MGAWLLWSSIKTYPDYLAFFNEFVGERTRHKILVDSNLDWGQELKGLKRWMDEHQVRNIQLAYFGTADPAFYGIDAVHRPGTWSVVLSKPPHIDAANLSPYIAISATHLTGIYLGPHNPYAQFLLKEPVATIGHAMMVFRTDQ